jgi:YnbE-like lipoprotein
MTLVKLTCLRPSAHSPRMTGIRRAKGLVAMLGAIPLAGCITLEAPDEPIVIELNINITQEVIYRLAGDAENTIDANADIF